MKIALVGYGKMGKAIERIALSRGHEIVLRISSQNRQLLFSETIKEADVVIEMTNPEAAFDNVKACLDAGVSVVCGSTGWNNEVPAAKQLAEEKGVAFLQTSNFSIGVNVFFSINEVLADIMNKYPEYEVSMEEVHHIHKKDKPSGTAITLAERIIAHLDRKKRWEESQPGAAEVLSIHPVREDEAPGTHSVKYSSAIDDIELIHTAHNRDGFAQGAVVAAEFIAGKKGVYTMRDVLGL
ncbi:4-hydroxy-tetrahydrodipicolinate reductase [Rurimicrobium arvi]